MAKSRCGRVLDSDQRQALVAAMLEDMLAAATAAEAIGAVVVVTPDLDLARQARKRGALAVIQQGPPGLNPAFTAGMSAARQSRGDGPLLLLPGDLPLITPRDLNEVGRAIRSGHMVLARTAADGGTGAIGLAAGARLRPRFGPDSFWRHLEAIRIAGRLVSLIASGPLTLDIDRPEDLRNLAESGVGHSAALVRGLQARPSVRLDA
jgi:2-phospho-L-lactate guanylyltransferase